MQLRRFEKQAANQNSDNFDHAMELGGLGILGVPAALHYTDKMRGAVGRASRALPEVMRSAHATEIVGLGALAVPSPIHLARWAHNRGAKPAAKTASIDFETLCYFGNELEKQAVHPAFITGGVGAALAGGAAFHGQRAERSKDRFLQDTGNMSPELAKERSRQRVLRLVAPTLLGAAVGGAVPPAAAHLAERAGHHIRAATKPAIEEALGTARREAEDLLTRQADLIAQKGVAAARDSGKNFADGVGDSVKGQTSSAWQTVKDKANPRNWFGKKSP